MEMSHPGFKRKNERESLNEWEYKKDLHPKNASLSFLKIILSPANSNFP